MLYSIVDSLRGQFGRIGMTAPVAPAPKIGEERLSELIHVALKGLDSMYDPARELLGIRELGRDEIKIDVVFCFNELLI